MSKPLPLRFTTLPTRLTNTSFRLSRSSSTVFSCVPPPHCSPTFSPQILLAHLLLVVLAVHDFQQPSNASTKSMPRRGYASNRCVEVTHGSSRLPWECLKRALIESCVWKMSSPCNGRQPKLHQSPSSLVYLRRIALLPSLPISFSLTSFLLSLKGPAMSPAEQPHVLLVGALRRLRTRSCVRCLCLRRSSTC